VHTSSFVPAFSRNHSVGCGSEGLPGATSEPFEIAMPGRSRPLLDSSTPREKHIWCTLLLWGGWRGPFPGETVAPFATDVVTVALKPWFDTGWTCSFSLTQGFSNFCTRWRS
jgi:hypothetical protein